MNAKVEETLFEAVLALPAQQRAAYLDQRCTGDAQLRQRVEALLKAHEQAGAFMAEPAAGTVRNVDSPEPGKTVRISVPLTEKPGDKISHYKLLQQIGEGGCGVVYMAEQQEPIRRKVAFKVIKLGMDTKAVIARFEAERQALALMDHPNIAKVFDAGATDTGRPYFVMELVRGVRITDYCDQHNLPTEARLDLFMQVCHAIQHAHQKGIIHRDIKPSNILITVNDGVPVPKVIDFGIAKATGGQALTDKTLFTAFEQFIGTPAYMSPEQAEMSSLDIDTRSDIYALGVLLYELLTGHTPFDPQTLLSAGLDQMRRIIREQEPVRPSTRLSTLEDSERTTIASRRNSDPPKLVHLVRGDLDWIVMKCLEKDRTRRYETANGLANDILRHLNNEPVTAAAPGSLYKAGKFIRRHKTGLATASALVLLLAVGVVVSTWQAVRATQAERAQSELRQQAEQARANETNQRRQAEQLRATAEDQARHIGRQLYAARMSEAFRALEKGDLARVEQLLAEHQPKPGTEDLRGFEWFYLWQLCHSAQLTLRGHNAQMRCVAFSRDGLLLITAGDDSTARIWDARTGSELHVLRGHNGGVNCAAFAPDGTTVATGGSDHTVKLWDTAQGKESATLIGHNDGVTALAFGPDGKWLASATGILANGTNYPSPYEKFINGSALSAEVKIWDIAARRPTLALTGHQKSILSVAISPDGKRLATGGADATVRIWNLAAGELEANLAGFKGPVTAVAFSPREPTLAIGGGDPYVQQAELKLYDLATRKPQVVLKGHEAPVFALAYSPDGRTLASGGLDQVLRLWDVVTGDQLRTITGHGAAIWSLAYDPDGTRIATASWDQTAKLWDVKQPQGYELFPDAGGYSACFTPDGKYLAESGSWGIKVLEIGSGKAPRPLPDYETGDCILAVAPNGSVLASAGMDRLVTLWEVPTWRRLSSLSGHVYKIWQLAFSPDSQTLASADGEGIRLWDVTRRVQRAVFTPGLGGPNRALSFTPDGQTLIVSTASDGVEPATVLFLDATTGRKQRSLEGSFLALSPDGRSLAVACNGLGLIDLGTRQFKWLTNPHRGAMWAAAFSPDGKTLATASWDGTAKLWSVASGQELFAYKAPGVVWSVAFSPTGDWWAVGCGGGFSQSSELALFRSSSLPERQARTSTSAPTLLFQPLNQTAFEGGTATLGVLAVGASPLSLQWRRDNTNLPGATNATLTLAKVTAAHAGNYSVLASNALGCAASSNATLGVIAVREQTIAEVNFQDKQPSAGYDAYTYCQHPVPLKIKISAMAGAGVGGSTGLVLVADRSGFSKNPDQEWSGFAANVTAFANRTNGISTTNLGAYKLYATVRAVGLAGLQNHGRVQWRFLTPDGAILAMDLFASFSTNYQEFSFILDEGSSDPNSGGSWRQFLAGFDHVNRIQCCAIADHWLTEYRPDAENALCIGNVRFVRLVPAPPPPSVEATSRSTALKAEENAH